MLLSRGAGILKTAYHFSGSKPAAINLKQIRNVWCYRRAPPPDIPWIIVTEVCGGIMWWWVLWNLWHDFDHITGHFPFPRPCDWTDEELGIPPED